MKQITGLIAQYVALITEATIAYIEKLHEKRVSWYNMIKALIETGNEQSTNTVTIAMDS